VAAASAIGVVPTAGAQAAVRPSCTYGEINGSGNINGGVPNATRPGQKLYPTATIHNAGAGALNGVFFDYEIIAPSNTRTPAPDVWWHVIGGPWHWMKLTWYPAVKGGSDALWNSAWDAQIGNLAGHAGVKIQFSIDFPAGARSGLYSGDLLVGAKSCPNQLLGGDLPVITTYRV
jgi:hypothetical protein